MLLGIPENDQEAIRDRLDEGLRLEEGQEGSTAGQDSRRREIFEEYIDWRVEHPSDDIMTDLLNAEFEDETGTDAPPDPRRDRSPTSTCWPAPATRRRRA